MDKNNMLAARMILEITSADLSGFMNAMICEDIYLMDVTYRNDLTATVTILRREYRKVCAIAEKQGVSVKTEKKIGLQWKLNRIFKRPVLLVSGFLFILLACFLQSRVLFLKVEGNNKIAANEIIEAAEACGIRFGASRRKIRSEVMKNALLQKLPKLQWAGINTSGCVATISVREKTEPEQTDQNTKQVTSIVALRDGIIQNCTVYQGNPLCSVGQAVKAGQTLVSGYTDCGIMTKATQAQAEIHALTYRHLELITPIADTERGECTGQKTTYAIRIGKKVINFSKDSGNFTALCAKIYSEECWQLPGGFTLPVAIIKQTSFTYEQNTEAPAASEGEDWLAEYAEAYLKNAMIAGEVLSSQTQIVYDDSFCCLYGKYVCREMIGKTRVEQGILGEDTND